MTGHSVRFDKDTNEESTGGGQTGAAHHGSSTRLSNRRRRAPYQSQPNLARFGSRNMACSMYRLNHLNPQQKQSLGKSYANLVRKRYEKDQGKKTVESVVVEMDKQPKPPKRGLYTNKHIASAHKLLTSIPDDEPNFKQRLRSVMNTYNFQILMVVLIILDCVMVLGEMIIELRLFQNEDCHPSEGSHGGGSHGGGHGGGGHHEATTISPLVATAIDKMVEHGNGSLPISAHEALMDSCEHFAHLLHSVEHVFHLTSIFILFLFNVELVLRLYAESYKYFLHLEIALDALIVMVSFGLDIVFLDHKMKKYLYLLIILRVWRVLRVVHAIITAIRAPHERQIEKLKKKKKMLQRDLAKAYFYSNMLEEEIKNLRSIIESFEIVEEYDDDDDIGDAQSLGRSRSRIMYPEKIPVCQRTVQSDIGIMSMTQNETEENQQEQDSSSSSSDSDEKTKKKRKK